MSIWAFRLFSDLGFYLHFQFSRYVDFTKDRKRCFNALTLNLRCMWARPMAIFSGIFGWLFCSNVCQEVGTPSIEGFKLTVFVSFSG